MHEVGLREVRDVIWKPEVWIRGYSKIVYGEWEVKMREEKLVDRWLEELEIFLILSGWPRMMNSILAELRKSRLEDIYFEILLATSSKWVMAEEKEIEEKDHLSSIWRVEFHTHDDGGYNEEDSMR